MHLLPRRSGYKVYPSVCAGGRCTPQLDLPGLRLLAILRSRPLRKAFVGWAYCMSCQIDSIATVTTSTNHPPLDSSVTSTWHTRPLILRQPANHTSRPLPTVNLRLWHAILDKVSGYELSRSIRSSSFALASRGSVVLSLPFPPEGTFVFSPRVQPRRQVGQRRQ